VTPEERAVALVKYPSITTRVQRALDTIPREDQGALVARALGIAISRACVVTVTRGHGGECAIESALAVLEGVL
jgi:hypothetical protein